VRGQDYSKYVAEFVIIPSVLCDAYYPTLCKLYNELASVEAQRLGA